MIKYCSLLHLYCFFFCSCQRSVPRFDTDNNSGLGLAHVGSRAMLSFAFAFLRRAWRSGQDNDLCSELLGESLDALRSLPAASLFNEKNLSSVWLDVVERTSKFLMTIIDG